MAVARQGGITIRWVKHQAEPGRIAVEIEGIDPDVLRTLAGTSRDHAQWTQIFAVYVSPAHELGRAALPRSPLFGIKAARQRRPANDRFMGPTRARESLESPPTTGGDDPPPMLGRYEILTDRIRFEPQFPVQLGLSYRVELRIAKLRTRPSSEADPIVAWFRMPAPVKVSTTVVQHVFPSAKKLPENLLKFYIQFSGPMSRGGIYERIRLLGAAGKPVELPFLEIDEELWNPELTRLTLFIDPGRIKRGVQPLEEIGPAIEAGRRYTLVIDRNWPDGDGTPLKATYKKVFTVGPPDREPPDPKTWIVKPPRANTDDSLVIRFPEPMDQALVQRVIWVADPEQRKFAGRVVLSDQERQWSFTPETNWKSGRYQIVASGVTEDLAGNSIGRPFEVDLFDTVQEKPSHETVVLPLEVRGR